MEDERILQAKQQRKIEEETEKNANSRAAQLEREKEMSIYDGTIEIYGKPIEFQERMLMNDKISIYMPVDFIAMPEEVVKKVYFYGDAPQYVYAHDATDITIGFNVTEHRVANEYIWDFAKVVREIMKKVMPGGARILDTTKWNQGTNQIVAVEVITQSLVDSMYNLMFYSSVEGKMLMGFINFPAKYKQRLDVTAKEIARSYKIHVREEIGNE